MWRSSSSLVLAVAGCLVPPAPTATTAPSSSTASGDHNVIENSAFDGGRSLPWTASFSEPGAGTVSADTGELCTRITNRGVNNWDAQVRQRGMTIESGHRYRIRFRAHASAPTTMRPKIGMQGPPYAEYW